MGEKSVFITGATSFTGAHIARAFRDRGYKVTAALTSIRARYETDPLAKKRLNYCDPHMVIESCPFGSGVMLEALKQGEYGIFVNHGASIKGYREPTFDYLGSVSHSLNHALEVMNVLKEHACKRFIHSGSVFEADEGNTNAGMTPSSEAVSIYGASKSMVWLALRHFANETSLPLSKIIIPNPIGPLENPDRLAPIFVKMWSKNSMPTLKTPQLVRDNLPAQWLAQSYVDEAELSYEAAWGTSLVSPRIRRPSGFVLSNEAFVQELIKQLKGHGFKYACQLKLEVAETHEPLERFNTEHVKESFKADEVQAFWQQYCASLIS